MRDVTVTKSYNFVNNAGQKFRIQYGYEKGNSVPVCRACGKCIPFPVYDGTWFTGLPEKQMETSMNKLGFYAESKVNMCTGDVEVYKLPMLNDGCANNEMKNFQTLATEIQNCWLTGAEINARNLYDIYVQIGGVNSFSDLCDGFEYDSYEVVEKKTEDEEKEMDIAELDCVPGLHDAVKEMISCSGVKLPACKMVCDWTNCYLHCARNYVDFIKEELEM